jgi:hypothetical protein
MLLPLFMVVIFWVVNKMEVMQKRISQVLPRVEADRHLSPDGKTQSPSLRTRLRNY